MEAGAEISELVNYIQPVHFHSFEQSESKSGVKVIYVCKTFPKLCAKSVECFHSIVMRDKVKIVPSYLCLMEAMFLRGAS